MGKPEAALREQEKVVPAKPPTPVVSERALQRKEEEGNEECKWTYDQLLKELAKKNHIIEQLQKDKEELQGEVVFLRSAKQPDSLALEGAIVPIEVPHIKEEGSSQAQLAPAETLRLKVKLEGEDLFREVVLRQRSYVGLKDCIETKLKQAVSTIQVLEGDSPVPINSDDEVHHLQPGDQLVVTAAS